MTGPYRNRKDRFNRDGKRPIFIRDEKIENGVYLYLVECKNQNIAWHWRPRNKIWGWRRLYDEFLLSKRQKKRQMYANNNDNVNVIEPLHPRIRDDFRNQEVVPSYFDEKYYYEDHDRSPPRHYDDNHHNYHDDYYNNYDYAYREDSKYFTHSDCSGRSSSSSECQFHSRAWGTTEYEEPSLTITRVRKQYSSPPQPSHHNHRNSEINEDFNRYYSPWGNKHEFDIALNKLDRYYQDLFYSKCHKSLDNPVT